MATIQFKTSSPYLESSPRKVPESDYVMSRVLRQNEESLEELPTQINVALFGLGRAGMIHLGNLIGNPSVNLKYIIEADSEKVAGARRRWSTLHINVIDIKDMKTALNDPEVDACIVATPTFTHEELIVASLDAGKHVFAEKPISETAEGTARCYEKAAKTQKILFCAFNRRFDPTFSSLRNRCHEGEVGHIRLIKVTSRDSPLPSMAYLKISGGIFHDCAVHDIDMITWILGELPLEVYAVANAQIPEIGAIGDFDNIVVTFKFSSGSIGVIDISRLASYGYDQRIEVLGASGMIQAENRAPNSTISYKSQGQSRVPIFHSFPSRYETAYKVEMDQFIETLRGNQELEITDRVTLAVSKIASACEQSAKEGRPIQLSWQPEEIPLGYVML